jgi:Na+-driven multidrug efflux pump
MRAKKIAWVGATISFFIVGVIGLTVTFYPEVWLNFFQTNFLSKQFAILYLGIAGPFYCLFAAGQTLYFASQGLGKIFFPVIVGILRLLSVSLVCYFSITFSWPINSIFYGVAFGLALTGIGLGLCMTGPDWKVQLSQKKTLST